MVAASALASPADWLPLLADAESSAAVAAGLPLSRPCRPPMACIPERIEAPEEVPGSRKASILNSATGEITAIQISTAAGNTVPTEASTVPALPTATPSANFIPTPVTITTSSGEATAAWNQRNAFQNHARVVSFTSPAAAIGPVATSTISAASRARMTSRCPIAAIHTSSPMPPSTVAKAASVTCLGSKVAQGCQEFQEVTFSRDCMVARVRPPIAAVTATV